MKQKALEKKKIVCLVCPACNSTKHQWKEVYYDSGTLLERADDQYITWCLMSKRYVLSSL